MLLFLTTNMTAGTSRANQQYSELTQQGGEERRRQTLRNKRDNDFV